MKKSVRKFCCLAITAAMVVGTATSTLACTGYYVGKDVSADGTYLHGHTVDAANSVQAIQTVIPHSEEPGRTVTVGQREIPLPDVTYKYTTTPFLDGTYDGGTANEYGFSMTGAVTTHLKQEAIDMDPYTEDGIGEAWICGYLAATCKSVPEALEEYGKLMEEYGSSESNTFVLADQNEAWYLESYTGHQWVAVKCPDDAVAVFGNQAMLGTLEGYTEGEDIVHSEGLYSEPEKAGIAEYDENGNMDMFLTYCGMDNLTSYANLRTWFGHKLLAPSTAGEYDEKTRNPLFYAPDDTVTLKDIFELTRCRYEGTQWCPEETGDYDTVRVIGIERQANCQVVEVYPDLPAEMCTVTWASPVNAEHSPYIPLSNLISDVYGPYDYGEGSEGGPDEDLMHFHFKRLAALSEQDRAFYGAGVREYWSEQEESWISEYPDILVKTEELYEADPEAASDFITNYTIGLQAKTLDDADTMYDELTWYMVNNTITMGWGEPQPFVPSLIDVPEEGEEPTTEAATEAETEADAQ